MRLYPVLGSHLNCNPKWNQFLDSMDNGWYSLQTTALRVWHSLAKQDTTETYATDLIQEAMIVVFSNIDAWDTQRNPVSWASVVMRNSMRRGISKVEALEESVIPWDLEHIVEAQQPGDLPSYIWQRANERERKVLGKVLFGEQLTRNDYRHLTNLRDRLLASPEFKELMGSE